MTQSDPRRVIARLSSANKGLVIEISGDFNRKVHSEFRQAYENGERHFGRYEVDFKRCTHIDSTGLGMLLLLRDYTKLGKEDLLLTHCSRQVRQVLQYASFDQLFTIQGAE